MEHWPVTEPADLQAAAPAPGWPGPVVAEWTVKPPTLGTLVRAEIRDTGVLALIVLGAELARFALEGLLAVAVVLIALAWIVGLVRRFRAGNRLPVDWTLVLDGEMATLTRRSGGSSKTIELSRSETGSLRERLTTDDIELRANGGRIWARLPRRDVAVTWPPGAWVVSRYRPGEVPLSDLLANWWPGRRLRYSLEGLPWAKHEVEVSWDAPAIFG